MKLSRTNKFGREYVKIAKRSPHILNKIDYVINKLEVNPFDSSLRTHKLKDRLEGIWACVLQRTLEYYLKLMKMKIKNCV